VAKFRGIPQHKTATRIAARGVAHQRGVVAMLLKLVLPALAAAAAIGLLGWLLRMTQSVDQDLHLQRVALIRQIDNLDVQLNRSVMQSRYSSIAEAGEERVRISNQLGEALASVREGPISLQGLGPELDQALETFLNTIEDKFTLAFDFEARSTISNQRLVSSVDAVPLAAAGLMPLLKGADQELLEERLRQLTTEVSAYVVTPTPTNEAVIKSLLADLAKAGETRSQAYRDVYEQLRGNAESVMADKSELTGLLNRFLDRPTSPQLQKMEQAYTAWHETQVDRANFFRTLLAAYAAALLLVLAWLGLRLRRSYRDLDKANADLSRTNETLEVQVQERTKDLSGALHELRASQAHLVQSEKMASLGQMVAGVAHEINTPLGYARSNASIVRSSLGDIRELCSSQGRALQLITSAAPDEEVAQALADAQQRVETLNPEELSADLDNLLADADHGLLQIAELVASLKDFSRVDRSRTDLFNVNDCIDSALKIAHNQLKHRVEVVKSYSKLPQIECSPSQLNQVFMNLFTNAAQAITDKGKIFVHTAAGKDGITVRVLDNGCGMSEEVRARIFEPFFTTKPVGKGTGLGLSIAYRIVEDHGGRIEVRSTPGKGTEFILNLPLKQQAAADAAVLIEKAA